MTDVIDVRAVMDGPQRGPYRFVVMAGGATAMIVEGYDVQVVAYAAPAIIRDWHVDRALFGPVFGAALLGYLLGATVLSGLSDRFGRKRVLGLGSLFFAVLTIASAFVTTIAQLLTLRLIAGLGLGCSIPAAIALGVEYAPDRRRAFRVSLLLVGYTTGAALGGFLTAAVMTRFGWQSAFLLGGGVSILSGLTALAVLPESLEFLALRRGREGEIAAILRRFRPDLSIAPHTRFVVPERAAPSGLPVGQLFTDGRAPITALLWTACIFSLAGHYFLTSWLPTVLNADGITLSRAVITGALIQAGGGVGSLIVGRSVDRIGAAAIGLAFLISVPFVILIGALDLPEAGLMALVFVAGLFLLGGQVGLNSLASTLYPASVRASGTGWALGVGRIGSILGPVIGGLLIGTGVPLPVLFLCAAVPGAVAAGAVFTLHWLGRRRAARSVTISEQQWGGAST